MRLTYVAEFGLYELAIASDWAAAWYLLEPDEERNFRQLVDDLYPELDELTLVAAQELVQMATGRPPEAPTDYLPEFKPRGSPVAYPYDAKRRVGALIKSLKTLIARDPEQEVQGFAIPVLDAALTAIKQSTPEDPVVKALVELMSADFIGAGEPIRAADMLVVAEQLDAAIGPYPVVVA